MKRRCLALMLVLLLAVLSACSVPDLSPDPKSSSLPDLRLLEKPVLIGEEELPASTRAGESTARLDLWLDASRVMGGVNFSESDITANKNKYSSGGFQYRFQDQTGLYESLLGCVLDTAQDQGYFLRMLRFGNERLPEEFLKENGLTAGDPSSIRRDMLTVALNPPATVWENFSASGLKSDEKTSFYHLGSPMMNGLAVLSDRQLENPSLKKEMAAALENQIALLQSGENSLSDEGSMTDYPLLYALENVDPSRVSMIMCDPLDIRSLSETTAEGDVRELIREAVTKCGVFDKGCSVGLYAFTLDYMGKISSVCGTTLATPLSWGKLRFDTKKNKALEAQPMPRVLLCLVIGPGKETENVMTALEKKMDASPALNESRGSERYPLSYVSGGKTVTQVPFSFHYESMRIERPEITALTNQTEGIVLQAEGAEPPVLTDGIPLLTLNCGEDGTQPDRLLTLRLPLTENVGGAAADLTQLTDLQVTVSDAFLLTGVLENVPGASVSEGAQSITLRDRIYVFEKASVSSPIRTESVQEVDGMLEITAALDGSMLTSGYYRLQFSADFQSGHLSWETPSWVSDLSLSLTQSKRAEWVNFAQLLADENKGKISPPSHFEHAWGDTPGKTFKGIAAPDCPAVWGVYQLSPLVAQLQAAADIGRVPFLRYSFEIFVNGDPALYRP